MDVGLVERRVEVARGVEDRQGRREAVDRAPQLQEDVRRVVHLRDPDALVAEVVVVADGAVEADPDDALAADVADDALVLEARGAELPVHRLPRHDQRLGPDVPAAQRRDVVHPLIETTGPSLRVAFKSGTDPNTRVVG